MKKLFLYLILMIFGVSGVAGATFICKPPACPDGSDYNIWSDKDPVYEWLGNGESVAVHFNFDSYNPPYDSLYWAKALFVFWGKPRSNYEGEYSYYNGAYTQDESIYTRHLGLAFKWERLDDPVLDKLEATGSLDLVFKREYLSGLGKCDGLYLKKAFLIAKGCDNPVPEPATMMLFGSGLVGLAVFGRKKLLKK